MSMAIPRLPSGVWFSLLAESAANERNHIPEYPTFPVKHQPPKVKQLHHPPHPGSLRLDNPDLPRSLPQTSQPDLCLPLLSVSIEMQVDCNIAKTDLVQTFTNHGDIYIPEAWYSFPLYDGAAVTAFQCEIGDDKVLEGKVKPKDEAQREFRRAARKQEAAALVEEMAPDVFQTTIGNIPPKSTIKVKISYVEELHTDLSGDGIVVTIPTSVAPRYGMPTTGYVTNSAVRETGLSLVVCVTCPGSMGNIVCRSGHGISVDYGKMAHMPEAASFEALAELQNQTDSGLNPKHATARLSSTQTAMDRDFILFIPSPDDSFRKSRALLGTTNGSYHTAMMVTVRPSEIFPDPRQSMDEFDGEIIFLADRSGSMEGSKIDALKEALFVFLKSLPAKCKFNLYSFGHVVSSLWPLSKPYDDLTMQEALDHVSTFQADYGGTEVLEALRKAIGDRRSENVSSTQVILLTDGEIWQPQQTIEFVRVTTLDARGRLRVFSLGIWNQVSHQLIQGIGFFGGGFGEAVAVDADGKWKEAVIRMLKGAVMPKSWSYSVSLGNEWAERRLDTDESFLQHVERKYSQDFDRSYGEVDPSFVQAPRIIPQVHHFGQQTVYFLLDTTSEKLPKSVVITACSEYGGTRTVTLAVTKAMSNTNTVQHLAAKAAVRDLESQDTAEKPLQHQSRRKAEQLCQMYTILSKWTSFVAVRRLQQLETAEYEDLEISLYKAPLAELDLLTRPGISQASSNLAFQTGLQWNTLGPSAGYAYAPLNMHWQDTASSSIQQGAPISHYHGYSNFSGNFPPNCATGHALEEDEAADESTSGEGSRHNSMTSENSGSSEAQMNDLGIDHGFQAQMGGFNPPSWDLQQWNRSSATNTSDYEEDGVDGRSFPNVAGNKASLSALLYPTPTPTPTLNWKEVVQCQRADGLFHLKKTLGYRMAQHFCHGTRRALRRQLTRSSKSPDADDGEENDTMGLLIDTAMALAYIRSHFHLRRGLWDLLVQKAEGRLTSLLSPGQWAKRDQLTEMADSALAHAHYGRSSQDNDEDSRWKHDPTGSRCGVCNPQGGERTSSAIHDDGIPKCTFLGCDVSACDWDQFWTHVVEQGHIHSSCEAAETRYKEATAREGGNTDEPKSKEV